MIADNSASFLTKRWPVLRSFLVILYFLEFTGTVSYYYLTYYSSTHLPKPECCIHFSYKIYNQHSPLPELRFRLIRLTGLLWLTTFHFRNPVGRTGLTGRGILGRYGPNHMCTAIFTRSAYLEQNSLKYLYCS